ncbi:hypothetical protein DESPIG_01003 [Desulfovibrio piger ATCC 29098]|uniref:Uncharacterized protein n=1 Tax=Desulfovibrio piger ATCC 29098 TaxID=411464 RepID=B6WSL4_9BACT|nr:hypothetical protein DESPIG_01003 [Desulfovibrio piger ATCC 29098]
MHGDPPAVSAVPEQKCRLSRCGASVKYHSINLKIKNKKIRFPQNRKRGEKMLARRAGMA